MQAYILVPVPTRTVDHETEIQDLRWHQEGPNVWWRLQDATVPRVHDVANAMCRYVVLAPSGAIAPCRPCALRVCRHRHMLACTRCYRV